MARYTTGQGLGANEHVPDEIHTLQGPRPRPRRRPGQAVLGAPELLGHAVKRAAQTGEMTV